MERAAIEQLQQVTDGWVKERFPEGAVRQVELLAYGDDPVVEPGELRVRVRIPQDLQGWAEKYRVLMMQVRRELTDRLPEVSRVEVIPDDPDPDGRKPRWYVGDGGWLRTRGSGEEVTAVMARLEPADLETLDALITAGITANRSDSVRWCLARIRERPAFAKLAEWVRGLDELKAEF